MYFTRAISILAISILAFAVLEANAAYAQGSPMRSRAFMLLEFIPPTCAIELKQGGAPVTEVSINEFLDIDVSGSSGVSPITQARFSSDSNQDGGQTGTWTSYFDWNVSSGDWNATTKVMRWSFALPGNYEVWAEITSENGEISTCFDTVSVINLPPAVSGLATSFSAPRQQLFSWTFSDPEALPQKDYQLQINLAGGGVSYSQDITGGQTFSADGIYGVGYEANKAFDNDPETFWSSADVPHPHWVKVDFGAGNSKTIIKLTVQSRTYTGNKTRLKDFILQGSNNDIDWSAIYTGVQQNNDNVQVYTFSNVNSYRYYRIYATSSYDTSFQGRNVTQIREIEMMEAGGPAFDSGKVTSDANTRYVDIVTGGGVNVLDFNKSYAWRLQAFDSIDLSSGWTDGPVFSTPLHAYPTANFTWSPEFPSQNQTVQFTDTTIFDPTATGKSWQWTIPDATYTGGTNSTSQNPKVKFTTTGNKTVVLLVSDDVGNDTVSKSVGSKLPLPKFKEIGPQSSLDMVWKLVQRAFGLGMSALL